MKKSSLPKKKLISKASIKLDTEPGKPPLKRFLYLSIGINLLNIILVLAVQKFLPPQVPLFYGEAVGEKQLTTNIGLVLPGSIALVITIINLIISLFIKNSFLQKALTLTAFAVSILSLITVVKIILLIGSF